MLSYADDSYSKCRPLEGFGVVPLALFLYAGGAATAAAIAAALSQGWSTGEYNYWMQFMDSTIKDWDTVGWKHGCWDKDKAARTSWLAFWKRFSDHYARGLIPGDVLYLPDSDELPAKNLLKELQDWSARLNSLCQAGTSPIGSGEEKHDPSDDPTSDIWSIVKWGSVLVGGILVLNLLQGVKNLSR